MKKVLAILLAGMITASALAGCGGGGGGDTSKSDSGSGDASKAESSQAAAKIDPSWPDASLFGDETDITLKVWAPDTAVPVVKEQVEAFQKHYSDIKFKKIEVLAQGEANAAGLIINDADTAADVFGFPSDQIERLINAQVLSPVAKGFADTVVANNEELSIAPVKGDDGTLWAYPETSNGYYLVYDKSVVTDEDAKTLEGILEACKKAGRQFVMDTGDGFYACTFAFTAGVKTDGLTEDGSQKFVDYDEEEALATLMAFAQLMKDYKGTFSSQSPQSISTGFKNGTVGAGVDGPWNSKADKTNLGDKLGATKLPTIKVGDTDKQMISLFGYKYIGVNSHTKFKRASQILAYYLAGKEAQQKRAEDCGWGPSNLELVEKFADDPILMALNEQSKNAVPMVGVKQTIWTGMGTLGGTLYKDSWKPDDKAKTKELLNNVIATVKDEGDE